MDIDTLQCLVANSTHIHTTFWTERPSFFLHCCREHAHLADIREELRCPSISLANLRYNDLSVRTRQSRDLVDQKAAQLRYLGSPSLLLPVRLRRKLQKGLQKIFSSTICHVAFPNMYFVRFLIWR